MLQWLKIYRNNVSNNHKEVLIPLSYKGLHYNLITLPAVIGLFNHEQFLNIYKIVILL